VENNNYTAVKRELEEIKKLGDKKLSSYINEVDKVYNQTLLMKAAKNNNLNIVNALLKAGASTGEIKGKYGSGLVVKNSPLIFAVSNILNSTFKFKRVTINNVEKTVLKQTGMYHPDCNPNNAPEIVKVLLDKGVDVNIQDKDGLTPLMIVIKDAKNEENNIYEDKSNYDLDKDIRAKIVRILFRNHANVNAVDNNGQTALMMAVNNDNLEMIETLVNNGADVNIQNNKGETPLMYAVCSYGEKNIVKNIVTFLLNNNANVNIQNNEGETPLMVAAYRHELDIVQILRDGGADIYIKNNKGKTAKDYV